MVALSVCASVSAGLASRAYAGEIAYTDASAAAGNGAAGRNSAGLASAGFRGDRQRWADGLSTARAGYGPIGGDAQLSREVLGEMNQMRADPQGYIAVLQAYRTQFQGDLVIRPGRITIQTREGVAAVDEAIRYLRQQKPMASLRPDLTLALSAGDHVADQGPTGYVGHHGSDGWDFAQRVARRGGDPYGGENISYGYDTAREVVIQLLVDDNVADRGHRVNLFRDGYVRAGVSCGPHAAYNHMCVIDYGYEPIRNASR